MTCRFLDSFAHYNTQAFMATKWTTATVNSFTTGRNGAQCCHMTSTNVITKTIDAQATWAVGLAVKSSAGSGSPIISFFDVATTQCDVRINADGTLSATRNGTVLGTSVLTMPTGVFVYLEVQVTISDASGVFKVNVNGTSLLNLSGQDTKNTVNASANVIKINCSTSTLDIQDCYIFDGNGSTDNAIRGDSRVQATYALADGADTGWALTGAASKHAAVAQNPPATANYISSAAAVDNYTATYAAPQSLGPIAAVQVVISAEKDDVNATTIAPIVRHAGTDNVGTAVSPTNGSYLFFCQAYDVNPGTGVAWTQSDIVTDEFGVQRVT